MSVFIDWLLFQLTKSKHPRTPAAKTGRQALDNKLSLLSKTRKVMIFYHGVRMCFVRDLEIPRLEVPN